MYITGNHDEFLRDYIEEHQFVMGNIQVLNEAFHETADGRKLWVVHGDDYDGVTRHHRWVAIAGDMGYNFLSWSNSWFNAARRILRMPYWSLSKAIKNKVKKAVSFIFEFEQTIAKEARKRKVDGVVCGHIHHAEKKMIDDILYLNCGDWVESCTALAEDEEGNIEIISWADKIDNGKVIPMPEQDNRLVVNG
jgi:UDP-2,3-diacylglucosamine pyrophosphatase LpxH